MSLVLDINEYKRMLASREADAVISVYKEYLAAAVRAEPMKFIEMYGEAQKHINLIIEASRRPTPTALVSDMPNWLDESPAMRTIRIPYIEYERLRAIDKAIHAILYPPASSEDSHD